MKNPLTILIGSVLAGSIIIAIAIMLAFHWEFSVAANPEHIVVFRADRWTGSVTLCAPVTPLKWECTGVAPPKPPG
jgi:hypothetical protein